MSRQFLVHVKFCPVSFCFVFLTTLFLVDDLVFHTPPAGVGVTMHSLPLMYTGFGLVGGAGWGLAYVMPVSALLAWFPDKRGLALGMGMTAFGTGTMAAVAGIEKLMAHFSKLPEYVGQAAEVALTSENGRLVSWS